MKNRLVFYRLITFILLPIAGLNAIALLVSLPSLLANPLLLIFAFIEFAIVAYTFTSFIFFIKGVQNGGPLKRSLKDWIKLNGVITLVYAGVILLCVLLLLLAVAGMGAGQFQKLMADAVEKMKNSGTLLNTNARDLARQLTSAFIIGGCYSALLFTHVIITLRLLKKYASVFGSDDNRPGNGDLL